MDPDRPPVWIALADLFLDTDVRPEFPRIAQTLAASPYTAKQLADIYHYEVKPVFWANGFAGEWAGWDPGQVVRLCAPREGRRFALSRWVTIMDRDFLEVMRLVEDQRRPRAGRSLQ